MKLMFLVIVLQFAFILLKLTVLPALSWWAVAFPTIVYISTAVALAALISTALALMPQDDL